MKERFGGFLEGQAHGFWQLRGCFQLLLVCGVPAAVIVREFRRCSVRGQAEMCTATFLSSFFQQNGSGDDARRLWI